MKMTALAAVALAAAFAAPAVAGPPAGALPLSEVLRVLEESGEVAWIKDVDWDDEGHWEIEYLTADGDEVEVRMDPITGLPHD